MINGQISEEMKSRLIRANLPATYEELVALAAGVGVPADIILNEEGWLQLPTYLNKENLMDDVTEEAIWGDAANRTVNAALKMLADVAYGRVATLNLTVLDTTGAPIPDVTVKLDSPPVVGTDPRTAEDGKITISTNGGQHTLYLVYPMGFTTETTNQSVEISGTRELTVNTAACRANDYVYKIASSKNFYIARHLSPIKFDLRGGGGAGALKVSSLNSGSSINCQGGAGGYSNVQTNIDVSGKLIRAIVGAGGLGRQTTSRSYSASGGSGGQTTLYVGDTSYSAAGGSGGGFSVDKNSNGGAAGGGGTDRVDSAINRVAAGAPGPRLFGESNGQIIGGGGGGGYVSFPRMDTYETYGGEAGNGGGTRGIGAQQGLYDDLITETATHASGSGGCAVNPYYASTATFGTGNGGPGIVAFKKAV